MKLLLPGLLLLLCGMELAAQPALQPSLKVATGTSAELTAEQREQAAQAEQLYNDGLALAKQSKYAEAIEKLAESLRIRREVLGENDLQTAATESWLASMYRTAGDYEKAETLYEQALAVVTQVLGKEHPETATGLNNLAFVCTLRGDDQRAKSLYEQALAIRQRVFGQQHLNTATSLNNLGSVYRSLGSYDKAQAHFEQSLEIRNALLGADHPSTAAVLNNMAVAHLWQGHYDRAAPLYEQSLKIVRQTLGNDHGNTATCLCNLALLATMTGDYALAERRYDEALTIFRKTLGDSHPVTLQIEADLALLYTATGNTDQAQPLFEHSVERLASSLGAEHPATVRIRSNLALLYHRLGQDAEAEKLYQQCLKSRTKVLGAMHSETAASHLNLGRLYQDRGDLVEAETHYAQALAIQQDRLGREHAETAASLENLGLLQLTRGNDEAAQELIGECLAIRRRLLDVTAVVQTERQQLLMNQSVRGALDDWLSLPAVTPEAAYAAVLRWKGAVFLRQAALRALRTQPELAPLVERLQQVSSQLARNSLGSAQDDQPAVSQDRLQQLSEERQRLEVELSRNSQTHLQANRLANLDPAELLRVLPESTALVDILEYDRFLPPPADERTAARRERQFVAFVVRPDRDDIQRIELGAAGRIDGLVDRWHQESRDTANSPLTAPAQELRRVVWLPIAAHLEGIDTVLISPDGSLGKLPFAALPGSEPESYLLEERAVVLIPVPQTLVSLLAPVDESSEDAPDSSDPSSMLILGGINYDYDAREAMAAAQPAKRPGRRRAGRGLTNWDALPGTRDEAAAIQNTFQRARPLGNVKLLQDNIPTEETVQKLAPQYRYLHFATHGFFAPEQLQSALDKRGHDGSRGGAGVNQAHFMGYLPGLLSGIALAGANKPGEQDDGILTALEVSEMDLSEVRLVVLSACETGLGRVAGGEGLLGLQRSFQLAGAKSTIATLWQVNDSASRDVMSRFYENFWIEELDTIECLRQAQLEMLNDSKERAARLGRTQSTVKKPRTAPYYWAAFVLSGNWL